MALSPRPAPECVDLMRMANLRAETMASPRASGYLWSGLEFRTPIGGRPRGHLMTRHDGWAAMLSVLALGLGVRASAGAEPDKAEITWPGMTRAGTVLLPNGW